MRLRKKPETDTAGDTATLEAPRRGFFRRHRVLLLVFASVVSILVASVAGYALLLNHSLSNVKKVPVTINEAKRPAADSGKALNILMLGADAGKARHPNGEGKSILDDAASNKWPVGKYRSDAMMLVHISADRKKAYVISVPRDSYVKVYDSTGEARQDTKINAALSLYGPSGAISTLENLANLRINHLAMVDWDGFESITNSLGGVNVTIPGEGTSNLKGKAALAYVRERHNLPNGDFDRVKRQQNFLRAIMTKIVERGTLTNPIKLRNTLDSTTKNLAVDDDWSASGMRSLAFSMRHIRPSKVKFMTLPTSGTATDSTAGSIVVVDRGKSADLFKALKDDEVAAFLAANPDTELGGTRGVS